MKKLLIAVIMLFVLASCEKEPTLSELIVGDWQVVEATADGYTTHLLQGSNVYAEITFSFEDYGRGEGKIQVCNDNQFCLSETNSYSWTVVESTLTLDYDDPDSDNLSTIIAIDGNRMDWGTLETGYYLIRK